MTISIASTCVSRRVSPLKGGDTRTHATHHTCVRCVGHNGTHATHRTPETLLPAVPETCAPALTGTRARTHAHAPAHSRLRACAHEETIRPGAGLGDGGAWRALLVALPPLDVAGDVEGAAALPARPGASSCDYGLRVERTRCATTVPRIADELGRRGRAHRLERIETGRVATDSRSDAIKPVSRAFGVISGHLAPSKAPSRTFPVPTVAGRATARCSWAFAAGPICIGADLFAPRRLDMTARGSAGTPGAGETSGAAERVGRWGRAAPIALLRFLRPGGAP
jgi:hypothetical protein